MPSIMKSLALNYATAEDEFAKFKEWFSSNEFFNEQAVVGQLKKYDHLCLLIGFLGTRRRPNIFKHEFAIAGAFKADYVVANSGSREFTFVEFEGGNENSLFGPASTNQLRDWGSQIQRGYSQIVDWTWAKNDIQKDVLFQNAIGFPNITETYVLICGRDRTMDSVEKTRLEWRNDKTSIAASDVLFMTYDDLMAHFESMLDVYRDALAEAASAK